MKHTYIIAEAGVNHNGSIDIAKNLVEAAKKFGADAVKFQTFRADNLVSRNAEKAEYQKSTTGSSETQYEMIKKLEMNIPFHQELLNHCKDQKIQFISSPFDIESIDLLTSLELDVFKIPSGEINNLPFLKKIGKLNKKIILSTGMAYLGEIEDALNILINNGTDKENITLLQCNTEYPTPFEDVNLLAMQTIKNSFFVKVGYSDHTPGIEAAIAAVALGAEIIEKHFTLDKKMEGPDHKASLEPHEFGDMVKAIRNIEKGLGSGIKAPSDSEKKNIRVVRKSIVAAKEIKKGDIFSEENMCLKRPGYGISPMRWDELIGQPARTDFQTDDMITL